MIYLIIEIIEISGKVQTECYEGLKSYYNSQTFKY